LRIRTDREDSCERKSNLDKCFKEAIIGETERSKAEAQKFHQEMVEGDVGTTATQVARRTVSELKITGVMLWG
jgi:hypothetical protein